MCLLQVFVCPAGLNCTKPSEPSRFDAQLWNRWMNYTTDAHNAIIHKGNIVSQLFSASFFIILFST